MKEKPIRYDWAAYYQAAYKKEVKKNMVLAGKVADAEARESDIVFHLERIQNNILWKMSAPIRKCLHILEPEDADDRTARHTAEAENHIQMYRQEVFRQKHPYLQWIAEYNNGCDDKLTERSYRFIDGWQKIELGDTDLCIILCGYGFLDAKTDEIVKAYFQNNKNCLFAYADEDYFGRNYPIECIPGISPAGHRIPCCLFVIWGI